MAVANPREQGRCERDADGLAAALGLLRADDEVGAVDVLTPESSDVTQAQAGVGAEQDHAAPLVGGFGVIDQHADFIGLEWSAHGAVILRESLDASGGIFEDDAIFLSLLERLAEDAEV